MLDGAPGSGGRARRAPHEGLLPYPGKLVQSSLRFDGRARRARSIARPLGVGRGEPTPARGARLGAPRVHHIKRRNGRMLVGWERAA